MKIKLKVILDHIDFDGACKQVYRMALDHFQIDENGHCHKYPNIQRTEYVLEVKFREYRHIGSMAGQHVVYTFDAAIIVEEDNSD